MSVEIEPCTVDAEKVEMLQVLTAPSGAYPIGNSYSILPNLLDTLLKRSNEREAIRSNERMQLDRNDVARDFMHALDRDS